VQVLDVLGASATMYQDVVVTAAQRNASHLANVVDDLLAASAGSADATSRVIATVGATLNSVDCSKAPNCAALHRMQCTTTTGTFFSSLFSLNE
jgi:hypothetical protein